MTRELTFGDLRARMTCDGATCRAFFVVNGQTVGHFEVKNPPYYAAGAWWLDEVAVYETARVKITRLTGEIYEVLIG